MAIKYSPRQLEIANLLARYGVLGIKMIHTLLSAPSTMVQLLETLKGMEKRGSGLDRNIDKIKNFGR